MTISDIVNSVYFRTKTNSSSFLAANMLLYINNAYDRVASLILRTDSKWQFDDSNYADLPNATTTITSGQQDYSLATSHLTIDRVEVKDSGGTWHLLTPIDRSDITQEPLAQGETTRTGAYLSSNGIPQEYDSVGNSIFLYPTPNFTQSASVKVYFTRGPDKFTSAQVTTGTKEPGFNSLFHDLIPLWVSYEYAIANGLKTANGFLASIRELEKQLDDFYGNRKRDEKNMFTVSTNGRQSGISGRTSSWFGGDSNK